MDPSQDKTPPPELASASPATVPARRRILQGALAAGPVMLTLMSRPVLGKTGVGCPLATAGFMSAGSLRAGQVQQACSGKTASYWSNNTDAWPSPYVANSTSTFGVAGLGGKATPATLFHSPTTGFNGNQFRGKPLSEVLQVPDGGISGAGKYCGAALLNAASQSTPPITETMIRTLWNDLVTRGYYEPTAGVRWYSEDIVRYIRATFR